MRLSLFSIWEGEGVYGAAGEGGCGEGAGGEGGAFGVAEYPARVETAAGGTGAVGIQASGGR